MYNYYSDHNSVLKDKYNLETRKNLYWAAFFLDSLELLSKIDMTTIEYRTILYLCSKIDQVENVAYIKQSTIVEDLSVDKSNLSKAIKELRQKQLITKIKGGYMINPNIIYKGAMTSERRKNLHETFEKNIAIEKRNSSLDFSSTLDFEYF